MRRNLFLGLAALALVVAGGVLLPRRSILEAQEPKAPSPAEMQAMMAKCIAAGTPGEPHRFLQTLAGTWDVECEFWMGGPGTPAETSRGESRVKPVLDGRYVMEEFSTTVTMPDPKDPSRMAPCPFQGIGFTGYDNTRNLYVGTWMDSMSTTILRLTGSRDPAGRKLTMYGEMDEPAMNVIGRLVKYVTHLEGPDKHVFECYDLHAGDDYRIMRLTYNRRK